MKKILFILSASLALSGCKSTPDKEMFFSRIEDPLQIQDINKIYSNEIKLKESDYVPFVNDNPNRFSLVIIPDTQGYTSSTSNYDMDKNYPLNNIESLNNQLNFIAKNSVKNGGDFSFAAHVGDLVNWPSKYKKEWKLAAESMSILIDEIPYIIVPGNHDFNYWYKETVHGLSQYKKYFGAKSQFFKNQKFFGGNNPNGTDIYCYFEACNYKFLVIGLEYEPSEKNISWAQKIIDENKGLPTIIVTHGYIETNKTGAQSKYTTRSYRNPKENYLGEQIWENLVKDNDQIFLVLCGHAFNGNNGSGFRSDKNSSNNTTYAVLSNYQGRVDNATYYGYNGIKSEFGGDGWLTILNFDLQEKNIYIKTYSTEFNCYEEDKKSDFVIPIDWDWASRFTKEYLK